MQASQASQAYGAAASDWSFQRGELYPSGKTLTIKDLMAMENDETVAAMFYGIETTLAKADWKHEPRDDGEESTSDEALAAAKFADSLFADMETSLQDYIENAVNFLLGGYSLAEVMFRQRTRTNGSRFSDNLWGVKSIVEREQVTVTRWIVENNEIVAFEQNTVAGPKRVPLAKCLHLMNKGGPNKPQGKSLFKAAHRPYRLKRRVQDSEAIGIERDLCGLPVMSMPQEDIDAATDSPDTPEGKKAAARVAAALAATQDMRLNDAGGLVLPSDTFLDDDGKSSAVRRYDFKIVTSAGSRTIDTRGAIRDYDLMIMRIAMMQFLRLGDRAGGSYALSDTQSSLALRAIRAIVKKIAAEWKRKVLTAIWILNGMDFRYMPDLGSADITEDSLEEIGGFLESLASAENLLNNDDELYEDMTRRLGPRRNGKANRTRPAPVDPEQP